MLNVQCAILNYQNYLILKQIPDSGATRKCQFPPPPHTLEFNIDRCIIQQLKLFSTRICLESSLHSGRILRRASAKNSDQVLKLPYWIDRIEDSLEGKTLFSFSLPLPHWPLHSTLSSILSIQYGGLNTPS